MTTTKQLCHARYGKDQLREFVLRLIGGTSKGNKRSDYLCFPLYGQFGVDEKGAKHVCPAIKKGRYNALVASNSYSAMRKLDKGRIREYQLLDHLISGSEEVERKLAFINRCPRIGNRRVGLFALDIDNHTRLPKKHVHICQQRLSSLIPHPIYWEPSTSGSGMHGYLLLSWPAMTSNEIIRNEIRQIESQLSQITADLSVRCNELRGMPHLIHEKEIVDSGYGEWAKMPCPQTSDEMSAFLESTHHSYSAHQLALVLSDYLSVHGADGPQDRAPNTASGIGDSSIEKSCNDAGGSLTTNTLDYTRGTNTFVSAPEGSATTPKARMWEAIKDYQRRHNRNPETVEELVRHYESLSLHTHEATPKRWQRAQEVWDYAQAHYRPSHAVLHTLDDWRAHVAVVLKDADLSYTPTRRVKLEEAAIFGYLLSTKLQVNQAAEIPTSYIKQGSLAMRSKNQISCSLNDNKKISKLRRLFLAHGIITQIREAIKGNDGIEGQCRSYQKGAAWIGIEEAVNAEEQPAEESVKGKDRGEGVVGADREADRVPPAAWVARGESPVHRQPKDRSRSHRRATCAGVMAPRNPDL